jgi:hypothetical protein
MRQAVKTGVASRLNSKKHRYEKVDDETGGKQIKKV